ncbi:MAG: hypothetical protein GVY04_22535 [Cyanobacteria bacterium]|nr:hypothetical protein [Cyanobacteria bacterium GSL.Bin1]
MKNAKIKLTIWAIILVAGLIFFLQNRSPLIAIIIFGSKTVALPVGIWLILSAIAGLIASIFLQFLLGVFVPKARRPREWDDDEDSDFEFPKVEEEQPENFTAKNTSNQQKTAQSEQTERINYTVGSAFDQEEEEEDWESPPQREDWNDIDDDWNIEEPPRQKKNPVTNNNDYDFDDRDDLEKEREQRVQQSSVSSYRYRGDPNPERSSQQESFAEEDVSSDRYNQQEDGEEKPNSPTIYEANYRVIRPPLWNLPQDENEEDDEENKR